MDEHQIVNAISGALAGALTAAFVCPLDVLKTRLQVQRLAATRRDGIAGGLANIYRTEGLKGLYKGLSPTLLALLPNWAVYFTVYDKLKTTLSRREFYADRTPPLVHMTAAAGAGVATLMLTNPLWVVKTRMQTQNLPSMHGRARIQYKGTFDALFRISKEEGLRGLYSGLAPSMLGVCHVVIQFPLYEYLKSSVANRTGRTSDTLTASELVVTSALAKAVAATATYPHEVVRSHMHVAGGRGAYTGLWSVCKAIWAEDGIRGFYRGCATNLVRTTPAAALTFTSFELIARAVRGIIVERKQQKIIEAAAS